MKHILIILILISATLSLSASTLLIKNGKVVTVSGAVLENHSILIKDGFIKKIAPQINMPADCKVVDAENNYIYPGLIAPLASVGVTGYPGAGSDQNETGLFTPQIDPADAINPDDNTINVTRIAGVTTVHTVAGTRNLVNGKSVVMNLEGSLATDLIFKNNVAQIFNPGVKSKKRFPTTAAGAVTFIREKLRKATEYVKKKKSGNHQMDALADVIKRKVKAFFVANKEVSVRNSIRLIKDFNLDGVIVSRSGIERHLDDLKKNNIPVIWSGTMSVPRRWQEFDHYYRMAALMEKKGITFAFTASGFGSGSYNARNIPVPAAKSVAHGLSEKTALEAMTINSAEILGIEKSHGSIDVGKTANLVIWTGNPLQMRSRVKTVIINGRVIPMTSIQTELRDKFTKILKERKKRK